MTWRSDSRRVASASRSAVSRSTAMTTASAPGSAAGGGLARGARGEVGAASGRAAAVARLVGDDAQQPGAQRALGVEARQRGVGLHERLLGGVLGVGGVAGHDVGGAEGELLVGGDERLEGREVSALRAQDQVAFLARIRHHSPITPLAAAAFPQRRRVMRRDAGRGRRGAGAGAARRRSAAAPPRRRPPRPSQLAPPESGGVCARRGDDLVDACHRGGGRARQVERLGVEGHEARDGTLERVLGVGGGPHPAHAAVGLGRADDVERRDVRDSDRRAHRLVGDAQPDPQAEPGRAGARRRRSAGRPRRCRSRGCARRAWRPGSRSRRRP